MRSPEFGDMSQFADEPNEQAEGISSDPTIEWDSKKRTNSAPLHPEDTKHDLINPPELFETNTVQPKQDEGVELDESGAEGDRLRTEWQQNYAKFAPLIHQLIGELQAADDMTEHPAFIGKGANTHAFRVEHQGQPYAVRYTGRSPRGSRVESHAPGAVLAHGVPHLEQVVAISYDDGIVVSELMPGREIGRLSAEEIKAVSTPQLNQLLETIQTMHQKGISFDPKPSNLLFDQQQGFGIIDLAPEGEAGGLKSPPLTISINNVIDSIKIMGFFAGQFTYGATEAEVIEEREKYQALTEVMETIKQLLPQYLESEDLQDLLAKVTHIQADYQKQIEKRSTPEKVAEIVDHNTDSTEERKERLKKTTGEVW